MEYTQNQTLDLFLQQVINLFSSQKRFLTLEIKI